MQMPYFCSMTKTVNSESYFSAIGTIWTEESMVHLETLKVFLSHIKLFYKKKNASKMWFYILGTH